MPEVCGPGGIPGDPDVLREAAGMLESNSSLNADVAADIRTAAMTVLGGWSAPSAAGFEALAWARVSNSERQTSRSLSFENHDSMNACDSGSR